jgi:two-component system NtrC family sensor kinase
MKTYSVAGKRLFLLLVLLAACCNFAIAQKSNVDSLQKAYQKNKQDTTLVELLLDRSVSVYLQTNVDSGMLGARKALDLSRKIHYKKGEVKSLTIIATYLNIMGDLPGSLRETFKALPDAIRINDIRTASQCYNTLGLTYSMLKDYKKAQENYHKALAMTEKNHYDDLSLIEYNNLSRNFLDANEVDSALWYTNKAYDIAIKKHLYKNVGYLVRNFGIIRFKKGEYNQAIAYYAKSIKNTANKNDHYLLSEDYRRMAESYQKLNKMDSCTYLAKKAFEEAKLDHNPDQILRATSLLTAAYKSLNNYKEAYDYQQIMLKAQDSLFSQQKTLQVQNLTFSEQQRQDELKAAGVAYQNKVRFYTLLCVIGVFVLIAFILLYSNQARKKAYKLLHQKNEQIQTQHAALEKTLAELKTTQTQLIQSEKMASLGELTAGIAHEIQNPLNFVNNFSEVSIELLEEMEAELQRGETADAIDIASDVKQNLKKISHHGKRADGIVKGMLQHSRASTGQKEPTDINVLADEYFRLAYHGLRAKDKTFNAELVTHYAHDLPKANAIPQDIGRVLLNLFTNAFYAVHQKQKTAGADYQPTVELSTAIKDGAINIRVKDNGTGIPNHVKDKIMQPFFTTKPTGEGTGLGLSMSYDILVKGHGGSIDVDTKEGEYTEFIIKLPLT